MAVQCGNAVLVMGSLPFVFKSGDLDDFFCVCRPFSVHNF